MNGVRWLWRKPPGLPGRESSRPPIRREGSRRCNRGRLRHDCFTRALAAVAVFAAVGLAHDIPNQAVVRIVAKPSGDKLQLLVRAPLSTMRDVEFPAQESGYLDIEKLGPRLADLATVWIGEFVEIYEDGEGVGQPKVAATQISIPSDRSFGSFDQALAHVRRPLPDNAENLVWQQAMFDVLLEYPIRSDRSAFSMRSGLDHLALRVLTSVKYESPDGVVREYELAGDEGLLPLDPSWLEAAGRFVKLGFLHILEGPDHLLFLLCLVIPFRRLRPLAMIVTAFTVAHSVTLFASALDLAPDALWFPPLIETLIAASILYMALENIVGVSGARRRWMFAFGFGLVHGFGFSFALRETLQFAGSHLLTSLVSFNVGVELGQLLALAVMVPALSLLFRFVVEERIGVILVSAFVAHTSWHWLTDRASDLWKYEVDWRSSLPSVAFFAAAIAVAALAAWTAASRLRRRTAAYERVRQ